VQKLRRLENQTIWEAFMNFKVSSGMLAVSVSVLAVTWATAAAADDGSRLKGSYGFTGTAACLVAPGHVGDLNGPPLPNPTPGVALANSGFQPSLRPNDAVPGSATQAYTSSYSVEGIRKFNGDGTGTVKGTTVGITVRPTPGPGGFPHFPPAAGSSDFSFSFTYTVNADGSWTAAMVPGSYSENIVAGPRVGETSTVDAIPPVTGMVSQDGKTLIAAHLAPAVETHTYSNGDVDPQICHRSRVFIRLNTGDDGGDNQH
jgi:hypothetical protein